MTPHLLSPGLSQTPFLAFSLPLLPFILCVAPRAIFSHKQSNQTTFAITFRINPQILTKPFRAWPALVPDYVAFQFATLPPCFTPSNSLYVPCSFLLWVFAHIFPISEMLALPHMVLSILGGSGVSHWQRNWERMESMYCTIQFCLCAAGCSGGPAPLWVLLTLVRREDHSTTWFCQAGFPLTHG